MAIIEALAEAQQGIATNSGNWRAIHSTASSENNLWFQKNVYDKNKQGVQAKEAF